MIHKSPLQGLQTAYSSLEIQRLVYDMSNTILELINMKRIENDTETVFCVAEQLWAQYWRFV